eukprot:SM006689S20388  [mRNA]  locus=s6689:10:326:+ [translate_table: standard]
MGSPAPSRRRRRRRGAGGGRRSLRRQRDMHGTAWTWPATSDMAGAIQQQLLDRRAQPLRPRPSGYAYHFN